MTFFEKEGRLIRSYKGLTGPLKKWRCVLNLPNEHVPLSPTQQRRKNGGRALAQDMSTGGLPRILPRTQCAVQEGGR